MLEATNTENASSNNSSDSEKHSHGGHDTTNEDLALFMLICMLVGQFMKQAAARTGIPYTCLITVFGFVMGAFQNRMVPRMKKSLLIWGQMDPHLLLLLFIPALIFESAFNSDWHMFKKEMGQILVMAGPMLLASTALSGLMMRYILQYQVIDGVEFSFTASLLFGAIVSATDPVAVVALLKELGASRRLSTLIEGESLLNDGTAMVVFLVLLDQVKGIEQTPGEIVVRFIRLSLGGPALGIAGGFILQFILSRIHNNFVLEVNSTIFVAYLIFFLAESTPVHVSGILALVSLGLYMTRSGRTMISAESEHSVHHVWGYIGFIAETLIFILTGLILGERVMQDSSIVWLDFIKLIFGTYPLLHVIRFLVLLMFWPCLKRMGYGMTFQEVLLSTYAGLRGAVGMSLALLVNIEPEIDHHIQDVILIHVGGMALMTLLINATTTECLVKRLGLNKESDIQKNILYGIAVKIQKDTEDTIEILKTRRHFNHVDWNELRGKVQITGIQARLKQYQKINVEAGDAPETLLNNLEHLKVLNRRYQEAENELEAQQQEVQNGKNNMIPGLNDLKNLDQMNDPNLTFKGFRKKRNSALAGIANNYSKDPNMDGKGNESDWSFSPKNAAEDDEPSVGSKSYHTVRSGVKQVGKVNITDLLSELRHKYLTILKSHYWEFLEDGQCTPAAYLLLNESADSCMDDESKEMNDWEYCKAYLYSNTSM